MYQAGTLAGNPVAVAAGLATVELLREPGVHEGIVARTEELARGIERLGIARGVPLRVNRAGAMFSVFFTEDEVYDYRSALSSNTELYACFYRFLRASGVYIAPSQFEALFVSAAHTDAHIADTLERIEAALARM